MKKKESYDAAFNEFQKIHYFAGTFSFRRSMQLSASLQRNNFTISFLCQILKSYSIEQIRCNTLHRSNKTGINKNKFLESNAKFLLQGSIRSDEV